MTRGRREGERERKEDRLQVQLARQSIPGGGGGSGGRAGDAHVGGDSCSTKGGGSTGGGACVEIDNAGPEEVYGVRLSVQDIVGGCGEALVAAWVSGIFAVGSGAW
jgi:hypothetical protein